MTVSLITVAARASVVKPLAGSSRPATSSREPGGLNAFKQLLPVADELPERLEQQVHEGHEWLYVLTGKLRLALGDQDFELNAGEAAEFDTRIPHAIANAGEHAAEILIIFGQQGERPHLRARSR